MSEIKYGLISKKDSETLEKTIDLIVHEFKDECIMITEVGLFDCGTSKGILDYVSYKDRLCFLIGVDNEKDKPITLPSVSSKQNMLFIKGDSGEVYNQLEDNSQHLIFIDGDHSYIGVISDFYAYCDKVKVGGYLAFHDTGKHIKPFKDFQHGDKNNPDAYISVRKALEAVGVLLAQNQWTDDFGKHMQYVYGENECFELIFDEADETDDAGGLTVFKKLY